MVPGEVAGGVVGEVYDGVDALKGGEDGLEVRHVGDGGREAVGGTEVEAGDVVGRPMRASRTTPPIWPEMPVMRTRLRSGMVIAPILWSALEGDASAQGHRSATVRGWQGRGV